MSRFPTEPVTPPAAYAQSTDTTRNVPGGSATDAGRPVYVEARRVGNTPAPGELDRDVERVKRLARTMDARFSLFGVRIGLDSVIGLVPVVGDTATSLIGLYPLHIARKHGLPRGVQLRMAGNVLADWVIGLIPLAGDLFDVAYKANLKNAELLERAAAGRSDPRA